MAQRKLLIGIAAAALVTVGGGLVWGNLSAETKSTDRVGVTELSEAGEAWQALRNSTDVEALNDFLRQYSNSEYSGFARTRLQDLETALVRPEPVEVIAAPSVAEEKEETTDVADTAASTEEDPSERVLHSETRSEEAVARAAAIAKAKAAARAKAIAKAKAQARAKKKAQLRRKKMAQLEYQRRAKAKQKRRMRQMMFRKRRR